MTNEAKHKKMVHIGMAVTAFFLLLLLLFSLLPTGLKLDDVSSATRKLPIYCVNRTEKVVALTFDGAWGNEDTADLLDIMERQGVKATFFFTGEWISRYPDDLQQIIEKGHEVGNHSENHKHMSKLSKEDCKTEIQKAHDKVLSLTGISMSVFRAPFGDYNNTLIEAANEMGYHVIQWDVDSLDWKDYGTESIVNTVVNHRHLGAGSIILMHNGAKYTKSALEAVIMKLKADEYRFVTVSELIYSENYYMNHEGRQFEEEKEKF